MSRKIGILTYHYVINDGAILQAYSLSNALQKIFPEDHVYIIDYRSRISKFLCLLSIFLKIPYPKVRKKKIYRYINFKNFIKNNLPLSNRKLTTDNYYKCLSFIDGKYDLIITGSDEVFAIMKSIKNFRPFPNIYWLNPRLKCKKVTFAVSANRTDFNTLTDRQKGWMKYSLEGFDLISVRDNNTFNMINLLKSKNMKKIMKIPDPTFMYQFKNTKVREKLINSGVDLNKPILGLLLNDKKLNKAVHQYYKRKKYQIIALGGFNSIADINLGDKINPFEYAEVFRYFTFCITESFHGTIFSLKNKIPFISVDHEDIYLTVESKIYSLLKDFSLIENNYINIKKAKYNFDVFFDKAEKAQENLDYNKLSQNLEKMKENSYAFIEKIGQLLDSK